MTFAKGVADWGKRALEQANRNASQAFKTVAEDTVALTPSPSHPGPYAKGLLANQYYTKIGSISRQLGDNLDEKGAESVARIQDVLSTSPFMGKDNVIYFSNNVPYAYRAENLGWPKNEGWSGKIGAYKMLEGSIANLRAKYV
jgi:hypothetical protein